MKTAREWVEAVALSVASAEVKSAGSLHLAGFQADAARQLAAMMREWGGALLADAVGLGKTRVALAVAGAIAREARMAGTRGDIWCIVPSRLKPAWIRAADSAGVAVEVVTHAEMSRGRLPGTEPLVLVVDEAHRFRNPKTRRRQVLSQIADAPVLLVSGTPVANSAADVFSLLRVFLDDEQLRARVGWDLDTAERLAADGAWDPCELLAAVTVRRTEPPDDAGLGRRPASRLEIIAYEPSDTERWIWANLEAEVRSLSLADDAFGWPRGLLVEHVLRRWEAGPDALAETLADLEAFLTRRIEAARSGHALDRSSFREIFGEEHAQEVFPFLYPDVAAEPPSPQMFSDRRRLRRLAMRVAAVCAGAFGRDAAISALAQVPEPLLVFTSYQRAAEGLYDRLRASLGTSGQVGLVTGQRAEATGLGRAKADEILARFAPAAHGRSLEAHQRIGTLVATDCIAEGVDLQDCRRVVLADLPYSPLAVEQRVGRLTRLGSRHTEVTVYLPRPDNWNDSLGMRRRLAEKVDSARSVGFGWRRDDGVFATLTELERIAAGATVPGSEPPLAMRATDNPARWLGLARIARRPWLFHVGRGDVRQALAELTWCSASVEICDVPPEVTDVVDGRRRLLLAAAEAPVALGLDAPQVRAWRLITSRAFGLEEHELTRAYERLIRSHRSAVCRRLEELVRAGSVEPLLAFVETLGRRPEVPTVELVTVLGF